MHSIWLNDLIDLQVVFFKILYTYTRQFNRKLAKWNEIYTLRVHSKTSQTLGGYYFEHTLSNKLYDYALLSEWPHSKYKINQLKYVMYINFKNLFVHSKLYINFSAYVHTTTFVHDIGIEFMRTTMTNP